jgi:hypothetical protein
MIKLVDLINLAGVELGHFKIHCATGKNSGPLQAFFSGEFKEWQEYQNQKNCECKHILSLIHLGNSQWLFAGIYEVLGCKPRKRESKQYFDYSTRQIPGLDHLIGRAVVNFDKSFRASYLRGEKYAESLVVACVREERMTIGEFPGFNGVLLSFGMLETVVNESNPSWKAALSNVAGVYLITDTETGKLYVGSASGNDGVWQRWCSYAKLGHGGNKELRELLKRKGEEHAHCFQFTMLEVCDINSSDDFIVNREGHWKSVLKTREFGLNKN